MNAGFPQWKAPVKVTLRERGGGSKSSGSTAAARRRRGIDDKQLGRPRELAIVTTSVNPRF